MQRFLLYDVSWQAYERMLRAFEERRRLRITFDEGSLEIMTLSAGHERIKHLLGLLIVTLAEVLGKNTAGYGSLTMKRRQPQKGLEPDECFWIQHEAMMRNKTGTFNPRKDPPPDLALEVEISRSTINRMGIYAALKVPEVWRWRKRSLEVCFLDEKGKYRSGQTSRAFPHFLPAKLVPFVELASKDGEVEMMRAFRSWLNKKG
jgi:Uma2 family endonuclease